MDSRILAGLLTIALPAGLIGVTIWRFASNPLSIMALITIIVIGSVYELSYPESF
jgi:hypothetical protein